jgi:signal transduction histidine kinase
MVVSIATNLLSNAVSYCPAGGSVECSVRIVEGAVELCVANTNDSLTPADLEQMVRPFWRKDSSRSDASHSGLGLALVCAYAEVLGADFEVSLTPENRFVASVRFARASISGSVGMAPRVTEPFPATVPVS